MSLSSADSLCVCTCRGVKRYWPLGEACMKDPAGLFLVLICLTLAICVFHAAKIGAPPLCMCVCVCISGYSCPCPSLDDRYWCLPVRFQLFKDVYAHCDDPLQLTSGAWQHQQYSLSWKCVSHSCELFLESGAVSFTDPDKGTLVAFCNTWSCVAASGHVAAEPQQQKSCHLCQPHFPVAQIWYVLPYRLICKSPPNTNIWISSVRIT